jgi:hypothetical protein
MSRTMSSQRFGSSHASQEAAALRSYLEKPCSFFKIAREGGRQARSSMVRQYPEAEAMRSPVKVSVSASMADLLGRASTDKPLVLRVDAPRQKQCRGLRLCGFLLVSFCTFSLACFASLPPSRLRRCTPTVGCRPNTYSVVRPGPLGSIEGPL